MNLQTHIELRCPKCKRSMEVERVPTDYPEAVVLMLSCDECNHGDFAESIYLDAAGKHITRDPEEVSP